jgi:hypothetical protein
VRSVISRTPARNALTVKQPTEELKNQEIIYMYIYMRVCVYVCLCVLFTPWSRVLLEKLTGLQLVKKFPAFYGTRRCITAFTSARHLSLS